MSRLFDNASTQYAEWANADFGGAPLTIAAWAYHDEATTQCAVALANNTVTGDYFELQITSAHRVLANTVASGSGASAQTGTGTINTWIHGCAVFSAANSRAAYANGGDKGTNTTSRTPSGMNTWAIGRVPASTPLRYFSGRLAEIGVWNVALTDAEVAALGAGVCPLLIRPASLYLYVPMFGQASPEPSLVHNTGIGSTKPSFTITGATAAEHPRVIYPRAPQIRTKVPSAGGAGAASGSSTVTGVGASTAASAGSSAGVGAASATGASTAASAGSSSGIGAASGVGAANTNGAAESAGTGTAAGTGAATAAGVGSSAGQADAAAVADSAGSVASSSASGAATGVGAAVGVGVGSSAGLASSSVVGAAVGSGLASTSGAATASGVAQSDAVAAAAASGSAIGAGSGASLAAAVGASAGLATVLAAAEGVFYATALSDSVSVALGSGAAFAIVIGTAGGTSSSSGVAAVHSFAVGAAAGAATGDAVNGSIADAGSPSFVLLAAPRNSMIQSVEIAVSGEAPPRSVQVAPRTDPVQNVPRRGSEMG